jgi:ATP-binding cassette subfamily B multidrug efflux pump
LGRNNEEDAVRRALETVQIASQVSGFQQGIQTRMGEQGNNMSVGKKQLLAQQGRYYQMYQLQLAGEQLAEAVREESQLV